MKRQLLRHCPCKGRTQSVEVGANNVGDTDKCHRLVAQSWDDHAGIRFTNFGNVKAVYSDSQPKSIL